MGFATEVLYSDLSRWESWDFAVEKLTSARSQCSHQQHSLQPARSMGGHWGLGQPGEDLGSHSGQADEGLGSAQGQSCLEELRLNVCFLVGLGLRFIYL